jgi:hypothetical protein
MVEGLFKSSDLGSRPVYFSCSSCQNPVHPVTAVVDLQLSASQMPKPGETTFLGKTVSPGLHFGN